MTEPRSGPERTMFDKARKEIEAKGCGGKPGEPKRLAARVAFVYHEWTCSGCTDCTKGSR